jgi:phytoene dehydrogenase-like protein
LSVTHRAIVIGASPNGLVAAIGLAEAGRAVTVLEAAGEPGGAVRTEELTLPGFRRGPFSSVYLAAARAPTQSRQVVASACAAAAGGTV